MMIPGDGSMETLQTILGILVAVGIIIGYLKSTLSTTIHAIVDKMFAEQKLTIERQTATMDMLDKAITKMTAVIDRLSNRQHEADMEIAIMGRDVKALHRRLDDHEVRIEHFCQFCNQEHKGDMPAELLNFIAYGRERENEK